jgi:putative intracellular protease/amidase
MALSTSHRLAVSTFQSSSGVAKADPGSLLLALEHLERPAGHFFSRGNHPASQSSSALPPCIHAAPEVREEFLVRGERIRRLKVADVPVITFACRPSSPLRSPSPRRLSGALAASVKRAPRAQRLDGRNGDAKLQQLVVDFYEARKIVALVCHATCLLLETRLPNGRLLVEGKTWTGFANSEEQFADSVVGKRIQPFWIEEEARKIPGTNFVVDQPFREFAVRDGRLVTGQQQNSGAAAARLVVEALGR